MKSTASTTPLALLTPMMLSALAAADQQAPGQASRDEVRALVASALADAETRSSLLQSSAGASGHDGRFFLGSADGAFRLNIGGQMQTRYILNFRNSDEAVNSDDFESGFRLPRTRLWFEGNVWSPKLFYRIMLDAKPNDGDTNLQDAWAGYNFDGGITLRAGQGITAFMREWSMGDLKLFTVERSLQSLVFGQFRSQFVDLKYQQDDVPFRAIATFSDGFRSLNTDLTNDPADYALTGRAEWKFAGAWKQIENEYRSPRGSEYAGALGGAVHFEQGENEPGPLAEQKLFAWTADVITKGDGWNAMLAGVGYHTEDEAGLRGADFDEFGALAQAGVHVTDDVELIARYDVIWPDQDRNGSSVFNTVTGGFNYYLYGQAARFSFAAMWMLDDTADTRAGNFGGTGGRNPTSPAFGVLPSAEPHQVTLMFQFQLLF